ncbi:cobalt-precorrin-6A reductase [Algihabitans albus]|uniref:cobalt-precorrin-6A reductase n=1 Tax=Algihabitans albus TaxID=2164067 RepID=UPI000E5CD204|nr:cobalt-precorrin-6A reductase [Algihabitans albus]
MTPNLLVLGGTSEASELARELAARGLTATLSYAGRVARPRRQPLPCRVGGFGGADGLAAYLRDRRVTHVIDATHPFAAQISRNAVIASAEAGVPLLGLTRPPWRPQEGDDWLEVPDIPAAVAALAGPARRVMLAVGRQPLAAFAEQPQHHYLLRLVDEPERPPPLPDHSLVISRGPFSVPEDTDLLRRHRISLLVAKNAGGSGAVAKLTAARALALRVILVARPPLPARREVESVAAVCAWLDHEASAGTAAERGV